MAQQRDRRLSNMLDGEEKKEFYAATYGGFQEAAKHDEYRLINEKEKKEDKADPDCTCNTYIKENDEPKSDPAAAADEKENLKKSPKAYKGITFKLADDGRCIVAHIMNEGVEQKQAMLHVGDEIKEINGAPVANQSDAQLQRMLHEARRSVTFKIATSHISAPPPYEIFVRAHFDYDPLKDELIPCAQDGISFSAGDILQIISKDDSRWWQARKHAFGGSAGLIPSPELQDWRAACVAYTKSATDQVNCCIFGCKEKQPKDECLAKHVVDQPDVVAPTYEDVVNSLMNCSIFGRKKKQSKDDDLAEHNAICHQLIDVIVPSYEEVIKLPSFQRKTLVLLGAPGVGRRHLKNTLIRRHPDQYAFPLPHTSRKPQPGEVKGQLFYFVSEEEMGNDILLNKYLEYGTHEDGIYGIKLDTVRRVLSERRMAILDVQPQALKILRTAEFAPFVVFITPPPLDNIPDPDGSLALLACESEFIRRTFGHYFDMTIVIHDVDYALEQLESALQRVHFTSQWVPLSWIY